MYRDVLDKVPKIEACAKRGAVVLTRIDINSPIVDGRIGDEYRIRAHAETLRYLAQRGARVVALAHQGRPGQDDFTSLELHRPYLEKHLGMPVKFVDDVTGPAARRAIAELSEGEILLLENVRMLAEEVVERVPEAQASTMLVRKLAPLAQFFVFDGFAVAHRSQPSVVGFPMVLPSCLGLVMERELRALSEVFERGGRGVLLLAGGAKVPDTMKAVEQLLKNGLVERVATGGLVGFAFAVARHGLPNGTVKELVHRLGYQAYVERARAILERYGDRVETPLDFAVDRGGRLEVDFYSMDGMPMDIGKSTAARYRELVDSHEVVIVSGPMGYIEDERFAVGTAELLRQAAGRKLVLGGGHTILAAEKAGVLGRAFHVSTGGRAFIQSIAGEEMPALKALMASARRFA